MSIGSRMAIKRKSPSVVSGSLERKKLREKKVGLECHLLLCPNTSPLSQITPTTSAEITSGWSSFDRLSICCGRKFREQKKGERGNYMIRAIKHRTNE